MRTLFQRSFFAAVALCFGGYCFADTLTLKNGDIVEGTYLGGTTRVLRMEVNGRVQTYDISMVSGLQFATGNSTASTAAPVDQPVRSSLPPSRSDDSYPPSRADNSYPPSRPDNSYPNNYPSSSNNGNGPVLRRAPNSDGDAASSSNAPSSQGVYTPPSNTDPDRPILRRPPPASADAASSSSSSAASGSNTQTADSSYNNAPMPVPPATPAPVELPPGTKITVRMIDNVDSQVARVGDTFRASVDEPVSVNGQTVIPRGADVVAKLTEDDQSGKITGRTTLKLVLSTVRVNDRSVDITTSDVVKESGSRGARSAAAIGGGAVLGAIIGAAVGGGKGAAIGAGSGAAVGTGAEVISKGQRVKVPAETRLDFTLSYAVRI